MFFIIVGLSIEKRVFVPQNGTIEWEIAIGNLFVLLGGNVNDHVFGDLWEFFDLKGLMELIKWGSCLCFYFLSFSFSQFLWLMSPNWINELFSIDPFFQLPNKQIDHFSSLMTNRLFGAINFFCHSLSCLLFHFNRCHLLSLCFLRSFVRRGAPIDLTVSDCSFRVWIKWTFLFCLWIF
jgi:hypothetical protein